MHHLLRSTTCLRRCTKLEPRPDEGSDDTNCSTMQDQMSPDNVSGAKVSNAPLEKLHEEEPGQQKEEDKPGLHTEKHGLQIPKEKPGLHIKERSLSTNRRMWLTSAGLWGLVRCARLEALLLPPCCAGGAWGLKAGLGLSLAAAYALAGAGLGLSLAAAYALAGMCKRACPMWPEGKATPARLFSHLSNIVLVGATDGIGLELALYYLGVMEAAVADGAKRCGTLTIVGRKPLAELFLKHAANAAASRLWAACAGDSAGPVRVRYVKADVSTTACGEIIAQRLGGVEVDLLVYLASAGYFGPMAVEPEDSVRETFRTNLTGCALVTKHVLTRMGLVRAEGAVVTKRVVLVSSVVAPLSRPAFAAYVASKAAVDSLGWSLATELEDTNVGVQVAHLGATRTSFFQKVGVPEGMIDSSGFACPAAVARQIAHDAACSADLSALHGTLAERAGFLAGWVLPLSLVPATAARWAAAAARAARLGSAGAARPPPRTALVTGAARGLGEAIVTELLARAPGCRVAACDVLDFERAEPGVAVIGGLDLAAGSAAAALAARGALPKGAPVELLVCSAGVNYPGRLTAVADHLVARTVAVNLASVVVLTNAVLRHNVALGAPPPAVVLVSSLSHQFSYPGSAVYGATKEGLASYARALRVLGGGKVPVLVVYPGPMRTQMAWDSAPSNDDERVAGRLPPGDAAAEIVRLALEGRTAEAVVAGPAIAAMAARAAREPRWGAVMMKAWQLAPTVAKAVAEGRDPGL